MTDKKMDRKQFFRMVGKGCAGACMCAAIGGMESALAENPGASQPGDKSSERAVKRMEFVDQWLKRFFSVMDHTLDPETRKKLMMTNGKTCFQDWIRDTKQENKQIDFEKWKDAVLRRPRREGFRIEGNTIYFQYNSSAETGSASPEGVCLCPMVESMPPGLSPNYCDCSLGYVKEMHESRFGRQVNVELLDTVLRGGKRCKFKITVI